MAIDYHDCVPKGFSEPSTTNTLGFPDEDLTRLLVVVISKGGGIAVETTMPYIDEAYKMVAQAEMNETAPRE